MNYFNYLSCNNGLTEIMVIDLEKSKKEENGVFYFHFQSKLLVKENSKKNTFLGRLFHFSIICENNQFSLSYDKNTSWIYSSESIEKDIGREVILHILNLPSYRMKFFAESDYYLIAEFLIQNKD